MTQTELTDKLAGTMIGAMAGGIITSLGAMAAGQWGLMEKTGGIGSTQATDVDAVMDFVMGPGKYIFGAAVVVGLCIDVYRGIR